jgi:hypothetical protein
MSGLSQAAADAELNVLRNVADAAIAQPYVALTTTVPTLGTPGTELVATGYARTAISFSAPTTAGIGRQILNSGTVTIGPITGGAGLVVLAAQVYDAVSAGNARDFNVLTGTNDVQTVSTTAQLTAGTYTLNPNGVTSIAIPFNATAAQITEYLEAACGAGNVVATFSGNRFDQATPGTLVITFTGALQYASQTLMTLTPSGVTGGTLSIAHTTPGATGAITLNGNTTITIAAGAFAIQRG